MEKKYNKEVGNKKSKAVEVRKLKKERIHIKVTGEALLMEKMDMDVVNRYNRKKGQKLTEKDNRLEEDKLDDKVHYTDDGNVGFPASGFMKGMVEVAPHVDLYKKDVRGSVRVLGNILPITYKERKVNVAWGRQSGITKAPLLIVRPEFRNWSCEFDIVYNASVVSAEQVVNLVNWAGFEQGLGSWRPEKSGSYGQYEVAV